MNQENEKKDPGIYVCPSGNHHVPGLCDRSFYPGLSYVLYKMGWYEP